MRIAISGSTGLVGSALVGALGNHDVARLVRGRSQGTDISWDPRGAEIESDKLESLDAVVHLAGENIAVGRWSAAKKARIRDSRVLGTRLLCDCLAQLGEKPRTLISASAIGYYGSRGDVVCDEEAPPGDDFLAGVCQEWEAAAQPARDAGIRVVNLRIGVVIAKEGGALEKMLLPFKLGVGGKVGNGQQFMSWIVLDELVAVILHILEQESIEGPVNAVSPNPVTNLEFTKTLGRVLARPTLFPLPARVARAVFGEMADALLLSSTRVAPAKLNKNDYSFVYPDLEAGLRHVLRR